MNDTQIIKMLLDIDDSPYKSVAIKEKIREILDGMEKRPDELIMAPHVIKLGNIAPLDPEPKAETKPPEDEPPKLLRSKEAIGKNAPGGAKRKFDSGKLMALRSAGWSIKAIADEMRCTEQTIRNHMKKEGIK